MAETPFDLDHMDDDRRRCDMCNVWHAEHERCRCAACGDIFCGDDCLADHNREWHAGPRTDVI